MIVVISVLELSKIRYTHCSRSLSDLNFKTRIPYARIAAPHRDEPIQVVPANRVERPASVVHRVRGHSNPLLARRRIFGLTGPKLKLIIFKIF